MAKETFKVPRKIQRRGLYRYKHPNNVLLKKNRPSPIDPTLNIQQILAQSKSKILKKKLSKKVTSQKIHQQEEKDQSFNQKDARKRGRYTKANSQVKKKILQLRFQKGLTFKEIQKKTKINDCSAKVICKNAKSKKQIHIPKQEIEVATSFEKIIQAIDNKNVPENYLKILEEKIKERKKNSLLNKGTQTSNNASQLQPQSVIFQSFMTGYGLHPMVLRSTGFNGYYHPI